MNRKDSFFLISPPSSFGGPVLYFSRRPFEGCPEQEQQHEAIGGIDLSGIKDAMKNAFRGIARQFKKLSGVFRNTRPSPQTRGARAGI